MIMNCSKCSDLEYRKDDFLKGKQRYFCKVYQCHYSVAQHVRTGSEAVKQFTLKLH
jgi:transposase-like protein